MAAQMDNMSFGHPNITFEDVDADMAAPAPGLKPTRVTSDTGKDLLNRTPSPALHTGVAPGVPASPPQRAQPWGSAPGAVRIQDLDPVHLGTSTEPPELTAVDLPEDAQGTGAWSPVDNAEDDAGMEGSDLKGLLEEQDDTFWDELLNVTVPSPRV